jgi:hypothetical protein
MVIFLLALLAEIRVARIRRIRNPRVVELHVAGRLMTAADLGRLERACAAGLTDAPARVALDVQDVTSIDRAAEIFLARLRDRGAFVSKACRSQRDNPPVKETEGPGAASATAHATMKGRK